jgi:hypothetical protein
MLQVDICFSFSVYKFAKGFSREGGRGDKELFESILTHTKWWIGGQSKDLSSVSCPRAKMRILRHL